MRIVCWWAYRKIGGAVRRHYRPHKLVGRGVGHHAGHHAGAAKVVKILVCVAIGGGIGEASSWGGGSSTTSAAFPPPAPSYSEIPGLGSGWFGPSGPALIGGSPELLTPPFETLQVAGPTVFPAHVSELPPGMGSGAPVAGRAIPEHLPGTIENRVPVSEPMSTVKLLLTAVAALLFLKASGYPR